MEILGDFILNLILAVLSTYIVYEYYKMFFEVKENKRRNRLIVGIYFAWQVLSGYAVEYIPTWGVLMIGTIFIVMISTWFFGGWGGKLVFAGIYGVIWMVSEALVASVFVLIEMSIEENGLWGSLFSEILLVCVIKLLQIFFRHKSIRALSWKNNAMLLTLPVGSLLILHQLLMLSYKAGTISDLIFSVFIIAVIFAINISMFYIYIRLYEVLELKHMNSLYQQELDMYNEHMKEKETMMTEFRGLKHDLKNKLIYLRELLEDKNYEDLERNMEELMDWKKLTGLTIAHSDNMLIDVLINYKYEIAWQNGINFNLTLDVPNNFPLANSDLCVILGNALDNAIEANMNQDVSEPYIDLKVKYKSGQLIMIIENSFDGRIKKDERGNVITKKQDKENHGIGIASIDRALEKYNGFQDVKIDGQTYKLTMIMYSGKEN